MGKGIYRRLFKSGGSICVRLPAQFCQLLGWEPGDVVVITAGKERLILEKADKGVVDERGRG